MGREGRMADLTPVYRTQVPEGCIQNKKSSPLTELEEEALANLPKVLEVEGCWWSLWPREVLCRSPRTGEDWSRARLGSR